MKYRQLCYFCMQFSDKITEECPVCGRKYKNISANVRLLPEGSILASNYIVELRKKNNLSISELGTLANVSPGQVVKIEKGTSTPSMETLLKLSVVLQVPLSELLPCEVSNRETLGTKIDQLTQPCSRKVKNHILRICTELVQFDKNYDKIKW